MAELEILTGSRAGETIPLESLPFTIGKRRKSGLLLRDSGVGYDHARVLEEGGVYKLEDLGGRGTVVAGQALGKGQSVELAPDTKIGIGSVELRFGLSAPAVAEEAQEAEPEKKPVDARAAKRRAREIRRRQREEKKRAREEARKKAAEEEQEAAQKRDERAAEKPRRRRRSRKSKVEKVAELAEAAAEDEEEAPAGVSARAAPADAPEEAETAAEAEEEPAAEEPPAPRRTRRRKKRPAPTEEPAEATEGAEAPAEEAEEPAEEADEPAEEADAPAEEADAPAEDADAPAEEAEEPAEEPEDEPAKPRKPRRTRRSRPVREASEAAEEAPKRGRRREPDEATRRSIVSLEREIEDLKGMLEKRDAMIRDLREELVDEKRAVMQAKRDNTHKVRAEELEQECGELREKFSNTDDENFALKERLADIEAKLRTKVDASEILASDHEAVLERLQDERERDAERAAKRNQLAEARADQLSEELDDLKQDYEELEHQYESLALNEDDQLEQISYLTTKLEALESELDERVELRVEAMRVDFQNEIEANEELRGLVAEYEQRLADLDEQIDSLSAQLEKLEARSV